MKKALRLSGICLALITMWSGSAVADCRGDLQKYRMDSVLYEDCAREALKNKDAELLYLVGLWNYTGVREPLFYKPATHEGYKNYMSKSADLGNPDAQSMYIISEMRNETPDPKVATYRAALEKQTDPQSKFRLIQLKQIEGTLGNADLDELVKLTKEPKNYDARFYYAQLLVSFSNIGHPETLKEPIEIFESLLKIPDTEKNADQIKGQTRWQLYQLYSNLKDAEHVAKAEKYLGELARGGDILAMQEYAKAYETTKFGQLDTAMSFAWRSMAGECSRGTFSEDDMNKVLKDYSAKLTPAELAQGNERLKALRPAVTCMHSKLQEREIDEHGKLVKPKSEAGTADTESVKK